MNTSVAWFACICVAPIFADVDHQMIVSASVWECSTPYRSQFAIRDRRTTFIPAPSSSQEVYCTLFFPKEQDVMNFPRELAVSKPDEMVPSWVRAQRFGNCVGAVVATMVTYDACEYPVSRLVLCVCLNRSSVHSRQRSRSFLKSYAR